MTVPSNRDVDRAWNTFLEHDRRLDVSGSVEGRLRHAMASRMAPPGLRWGRRQTWTALAAAASLAAVVAVGFRYGPFSSPTPEIAAAATNPALLDARPRLVFTVPAPVVADPPVRPTPPERRRSASPAAAEAAVLRSAGGDAFDDPLQMIRVRIDAAALDGIGVQILGAAPAGLVDVDLVIGVDGWPRGVRRIRPVAEPLPD